MVTAQGTLEAMHVPFLSKSDLLVHSLTQVQSANRRLDVPSAAQR